MKTSNQSNNVVGKNNNVVNADTLEGLVAQSSGGKSVRSSAKSVRSSSGKQCNDVKVEANDVKVEANDVKVEANKGVQKVNSTTKTKGKVITTATKAPETIQAMVIPEATKAENLPEAMVMPEVTKAENLPGAMVIPEATKAENLPEILVINHKSEKETSKINASTIQPVLPLELDISAKIKQYLCFNIMAGRVTPAIVEANQTRGRLQKLMPRVDKSDITAITKLLAFEPSYIVASWNSYADSLKRVRSVSLQAMVKACNGVTEKPEAKLTFKEKLTAWIADNADVVNTFPVELIDLLIEGDVMVESE